MPFLTAHTNRSSLPSLTQNNGFWNSAFTSLLAAPPRPQYAETITVYCVQQVLRVLKESYHYKGDYVDELRYGLLRPDWEKTQA